jgi:ABC-2 type transport system permease protein
MVGTMTVAEKEMRDQVGSKRFLVLFGFMILLSVLSAYQGVNFIKNNTEATFVFIFSGAMFSFSFIQIMVMFGPILGMVFGFDAINKERTTGTLSVLLGQPIYRDSVLNGKFLAGAAALATLGLGTIAITVGLSIPMLGYGPTGAEALKIVTLSVVTVLYLVFWLSLGILFSVIAKKTSTSIMASIATWMFFAIIVSILANAIAGALYPLPGGFQFGGRQGGMGGQGGGPSQEFQEVMQKRFQLTNNIQRISPTELYENTAADILGVSTGFGRMMQGFTRTLSLGEALSANWANIAVLGVGLVVCFAASYMIFLRTEIRPGD